MCFGSGPAGACNCTAPCHGVCCPCCCVRTWLFWRGKDAQFGRRSCILEQAQESKECAGWAAATFQHAYRSYKEATFSSSGLRFDSFVEVRFDMSYISGCTYPMRDRWRLYIRIQLPNYLYRTFRPQDRALAIGGGEGAHTSEYEVNIARAENDEECFGARMGQSVRCEKI